LLTLSAIPNHSHHLTNCSYRTLCLPKLFSHNCWSRLNPWSTTTQFPIFFHLILSIHHWNWYNLDYWYFLFNILNILHWTLDSPLFRKVSIWLNFQKLTSLYLSYLKVIEQIIYWSCGTCPYHSLLSLSFQHLFLSLFISLCFHLIVRFLLLQLVCLLFFRLTMVLPIVLNSMNFSCFTFCILLYCFSRLNFPSRIPMAFDLLRKCKKIHFLDFI
jgi:hypothetical protein